MIPGLMPTVIDKKYQGQTKDKHNDCELIIQEGVVNIFIYIYKTYIFKKKKKTTTTQVINPFKKLWGKKKKTTYLVIKLRLTGTTRNC